MLWTEPGLTGGERNMPLHENQVWESKVSSDDLARKQHRQMLAALTVLLAALIVILAKDSEFWFPSAPASQSVSEPIEEALPQAKVQSPATPIVQSSVPARLKSKPHTPKAAVGEPNPQPAVTSRVVLPPLGVEVVTGDQHSAVQAGSNSVNVDLGPKTPSAPAQASSIPPTSAPASAADATARVSLSPGAAHLLSKPVQPRYPLLAKEMKIQGAVVLDALIGKDGIIQRLNLLSGPAILSTAAQEAVKQWRFRPYLQSGEAVETEARITVNFTIWTH
jgi:TonB family protein